MSNQQASSSKRKFGDTNEDSASKTIHTDTHQTATSSKRKFIDSDEDSASKNICSNSPDIFLDQTKEYRSSSGLKNTLHGIIYQLKLLMLFVNIALKNNYQFRLATEMDAAEKFDDLVFQFKPKGQDRIAHRFLQAKHKQDESKKITYNDLVSKNDGDFSLQKYFNSFRRIKQNLKFKSNLQDLIICSNINLDFAKLEQMQIKTEKITETDDFFPSFKAQEKLSARYKLVLGYQHQLYDILKETSDIHMLAKELCIGIKDQKQLNLKSFIIKTYHQALVKENIIVIVRINNDYIGKFNDMFIKNNHGLSEAAKKLREILQEYIDKINGLSLDKDTKLKLSSTFGKSFEFDSDPQLMNIQKFTTEIVKLVIDAKDNLIKIDGRHYKTTSNEMNVKAVADNINKLAGHVLIIKNEKIEFRKSFFDDTIKLQGNLEEFRDSLKNDLQNQAKNFNDLSQYQWQIGTSFITCEEEQLYAKSLLPNDIIEDEEIEEFFEKLVFAVNQPNETDLSNIIEQEMGEYCNFNLLNASLVTDSFEIKMLNWFKSKGKEGKEGTWIPHENAQNFFDLIEEQVKTFITVGLSTTYPAELVAYDIEFENKNVKLINFLKTDCSKQIFNLVTSTDTVLCAIEVLNILKLVEVSEKYKRRDSYIFMRLKTVMLPKIQYIVIKAFKSTNSHNLLVIDCGSEVQVTEGDIQELYDKLNNILKNSNKKIIFITKENDALANKFKTKSGYNDKFEKSEADHTLLTDLTQSSQLKLLEKPVVLFQGKNISFDALIDKSDEESKKIINSDTLDKLIKNEQIKIGNRLKDFGEIKDYYISRSMYTQVNLNRQKIEEDIKKNIIADFLVISGTNLASTNKIFVYDDNNYESAGQKFKDLCLQNRKRNIHWLKCELGKLVLHESQGSISSLVKYRKMDKYDKTCDETSENVLTETEFLEKKKSKVIIISDTAGMGKSTVLSSLSMEIKKVDSSIWVIRIDLNDFTKVFNHEIENKNDFSASGVNEVIDFLLNSLFEAQEQLKLTNDFEKDLFKKFINGQGKMVLLFDGFDEISPDYQDVVINLLQALKKNKIEKLFVMTRPSMRILLEEKLGVFSDILIPFSKQNQKEFLTKFWIKNLKLNDLNQERKNRLDTYADSLIEKFSKSIDDEAKEFIGIPLQTMMLAEIFQENGSQKKISAWESCREFINLDNTNKNLNLPEKFNLLGLYEHFVEKKFYNFHLEAKLQTDLTKVGAKNNADEIYKIFIKRHNIMALSELLHDKDLKELLSNEDIKQLANWVEDIRNVKKNEGIIDKIIDNKPQFIHRTFTEYFASSALIEKMHSKPQLVCSIVNSIIDNTSQVFNSRIANYQDDLDKKTFLHYAIEYNCKNIIDPVLNYKYDIKGNDILMHGIFINEKYENSNIVKFVNTKDIQGKTALDYTEESDLDMKFSLNLLLMGANIDGLTQEYLIKLTKYMLHTEFDYKFGRILSNKFAYEYHRFRPIQEKLLMTCAEIFSDLRAKEQSQLLSYFFVHGRVKVIDTLLSSIKEEKESNRLLNVSDTIFTPLDRVNSSDQMSDDERLEITKYLVENGGTKILNVIGLSDKSSTSYITTILQAAVQNGHIKTFEYFICKENCNYFYLHFSLAVKNQQFNIIKYLMENYKNNIKDKGNTPLHYAVEYDANLKIIKYCIDNGEEINDQNDKGETPLFYAIYKRRLNVLKYLVERGADVNIVDQQGYTALNRAIEQDERDIINYLLECEAKIDLTPEVTRNKIKFYENPNEFNLDFHQNGMPRLHGAIQSNHLEWAKFIIEQGADINIKDREDKTPLHYAAELQQTEIVEMLLQYGAIFDAKDISNGTAFDLVSQSGSNKIIWLLNVLKKLFSSQNLMQDLDEQLLKEELNEQLKDWGPFGFSHPNVWSSNNPMLFVLNAKNAVEQSLLHIAAERNDLQALNILLEFNQKLECSQCESDRRYKYFQSILINAIDSFGNTPLHLAALKGHEKVVDLLLKNGAVFNSENLEGSTPEDLAGNRHYDNIKNSMQPIKNVFIAIEQRSLVKLENCINRKTIINAKNKDGKTPLHFAASFQQSDFVEILLKDGADVNAVDKNNRTPLHLASENGNIEIVKLLLKNGAILNAKDKSDLAPFDYENNQSVNLLSAVNKLFNYVKSDNPELFIDYIKVIQEDFKVDFGTIFNIRDNQFRTILHYAARSNDSKIAEFLFKNEAVSYAKDKCENMVKTFAHFQDNLYVLESIERMFEIIEYISQENKAVYPCMNKYVRNLEGKTLLHMAVEYNKLYLAQRLARAGADVNMYDKDGKSPLHCVVEKGMLDSAKFLIDHGADVDMYDKDEKTPLYCVVEKGMLDSAKFLIDHGADVDMYDKDKKTPLHCVVEKGMLDSAKFLIDHGADVDMYDKDQKTPLYCVVEKGMLDSAKFLIDHGANVNLRDKDKKTPLRCVVEKGMLDSAKFLIDHGAGVNFRDKEGKTPLSYVVEKGMLDSAKFLIDHGANVNLRDKDKKTPLRCVVEKGMLDSAKFLIDHGANVNIYDKDEKTPLHCVVEKGMLDSAKFLIDHGADVDMYDKDQKTPLYCVVEKGMLDSAKFLIDHGANVNLRDKDKKTPLRCVVEKGMLDSAKFLIDHGARINFGDKDEKSPLHCVVEKGMLDSAKFLIDHGANVNCGDKDQKTPLDCAVEKGMLDLAKFLIDHGAKVRDKEIKIKKRLCTVL